MIQKGTITLTIINENLRDVNNIEKKYPIKCSKCRSINKIYRDSNNIYRFKCVSDGCDNTLYFSTGDYIKFTCFISFLSKGDDTYLPPFIPGFSFRIFKEQYEHITEMVQQLGTMDMIIEKKELIIRKIRNIGNEVLRLDGKFQEAIEWIFKEQYDNLAIFTNDAIIPWHWIYSKKDQMFLLDRFSCGTILVNKIEESLRKY